MELRSMTLNGYKFELLKICVVELYGGAVAHNSCVSWALLFVIVVKLCM